MIWLEMKKCRHTGAIWFQCKLILVEKLDMQELNV